MALRRFPEGMWLNRRCAGRLSPRPSAALAKTAIEPLMGLDADQGGALLMDIRRGVAKPHRKKRPCGNRNTGAHRPARKLNLKDSEGQTFVLNRILTDRDEGLVLLLLWQRNSNTVEETMSAFWISLFFVFIAEMGDKTQLVALKREVGDVRGG